ncbi:unnamed protein product [Rhizophagus irregularis]|nr:unnamed protein product [Rhizophagus irregularis]
MKPKSPKLGESWVPTGYLIRYWTSELEISFNERYSTRITERRFWLKFRNRWLLPEYLGLDKRSRIKG